MEQFESGTYNRVVLINTAFYTLILLTSCVGIYSSLAAFRFPIEKQTFTINTYWFYFVYSFLIAIHNGRNAIWIVCTKSCMCLCKIIPSQATIKQSIDDCAFNMIKCFLLVIFDIIILVYFYSVAINFTLTKGINEHINLN